MPVNMTTTETIGVISDTHGLMRPESLDALAGSKLIIHAGDVGKTQILEALELIAPVVAIKGNIDKAETEHLPDTLTVEHNGLKIYILHDLNELTIDPVKENYDVVISGHSHKPLITNTDGVLYLNPGAAGPRRFKLPVCVAHLTRANDKPFAKIIELNI